MSATPPAADSDASSGTDPLAATDTDPPSILCLKCGYNLAGHTGDAVRCPECGREYTRAELDDAQFRAAFLPWERRGEYGLISRLVRTNLRAWIRPGRYFERVHERREHPIDTPSQLLLAQYAVVTTILMTLWVATRLESVISQWPHHWLFHFASLELLHLEIPLTVVIPALLWPIIFGGICWAVGRRRFPTLSALMFMSLCTPAVTLVCTTIMFANIVGFADGVLSERTRDVIGVSLAILLPPLYMIYFAWTLCRRFLRLRLGTSVLLALAAPLIGLAIATAWRMIIEYALLRRYLEYPR